MFFVYILESEISKKYYIGSTNNKERRLKEHNDGLCKYTKNKGLWKLIYFEQFDNLSLSRRREKQIKGWKKRAAIEKLIKSK